METTTTDERAFSSAEIVPDVKILEPDYHVVSKIGEGGHGAVFEVVDGDFRRLALKVQKVHGGVAQLEKEYDMYDTLLRKARYGRPWYQTVRIPGIPFVYSYTIQDGLEYMIMEKLGDTLSEIAGRQGRQLSTSDVLMIGIQGVRRLKDIHENGILHRDIKPENLVMGSGKDNERTLHIIDFGVATKVDNWSTYDYHKAVAFAGTPYYAPAEALLNKAPTRKGDLESLLYTLLDLAYGGLPWKFSNQKTGRPFEDYEMGMQRLLINFSICQCFPELKGFSDALSSTGRTEKPDYDHLINLLQTEVNEFEGGNDSNFQWLEPTNDVKSSSTIRSEKQSQGAQLHEEDANSSVKNVTEASPRVPPGFESKICHKKRGTTIRGGLPAENTNEIQQLSQSAENNVSELQVMKAGKEDNEGEIIKICEGMKARRVKLETNEATKECDDIAPKPPKARFARRGRKRTFVKRIVCHGISRAVRAITGAAASKFVRIGGLRS